ncbi:MAG: hypothetical protein JXR83_01390 [Deltaproteobacteria bacterium]|nr:hypothetical protein [Deltaproteobacteria bacterium]
MSVSTRQAAVRWLMVSSLVLGSTVPRHARAGDLYIRFLDLKKQYLDLAQQEAVLTEKAALRLRMRVGGAGVVAVQVSHGSSVRLLPADPKKNIQVLSAPVDLAVGPNRVRACAFTRQARASCFGIWIVRIPPADRPPVLGLFESYRFHSTEFVRGLVLGRGASSLAVQTSGMEQPFVLEDQLDPRRSSHQFVAQIELKPEESQACFVIGRRKGAPEKICLDRAPASAGSSRRLFALVVAAPCPAPDAICGGPDATELARVLEQGPLGAEGRVRTLVAGDATAENTLAALSGLLDQATYQELLLIAYFGPLDVGRPGGGLALPGRRGGIQLTLQSLLDLADQTPQAPPVILLVEGLQDGVNGSGLPELTARKPTCAIAAAKRGEPLIRTAGLGGGLFARSIIDSLRWTASHPGEILCIEEMYAALDHRARELSEGTQNPSLVCLGRDYQHAFIIPP